LKGFLSDEDLKKKPQQVLSTLISYRNNLRTEMENTNNRINILDQKITEILEQIAIAPNLNQMFENDPTLNSKPDTNSKANIANILKKKDEFELEKLRMKKNYLDIHSTMRSDSFMFDNMSYHYATNNHSNSKDNQKVVFTLYHSLN